MLQYIPTLCRAKWRWTMPCYLFTFHGYGTWLPDREQDYVRRGRGLLPTEEKAAARYRNRMKQAAVLFGNEVQQLIIDETVIASEKQGFRLHYVATDPTHVHFLVSWNTDKTWQQCRSGLKTSLTRRLNRDVKRQSWFVENSSRRRVADRRHFDHLVRVYLPSHRGWKWSEERGLFR